MSDTQISSGIYFLRSADEDITIAMDNANLARRSIKGRSDIPGGVYTERMRKKRSHDQTIASEVWNAMTSGAIELFLQPKFDLKTRKIIGAEALTRWRNPDGSYKMPFEFIDVLENVGYITHLDMYIYEQVLKCLAEWKRDGKTLIPISVNFSRKHNNDPDFVAKVARLAEFYGVDKNLIEIEITESCFTQDVKNLFTNMRKLRENGFKIDIDDFGTGYSSLSVLLEAPVDIVKVDKVFIDDIGNSERSREYIDRICSLIRTTRKEIIFEGVETEEQAQILAESGHSMAQGWLFDRAISVKEFNDKYMN
jgi:EAL domain-containing protein (putative c-di-GMP-specific phosphodiesterase class I)